MTRKPFACASFARAHSIKYATHQRALGLAWGLIYFGYYCFALDGIEYIQVFLAAAWAFEPFAVSVEIVLHVPVKGALEGVEGEGTLPAGFLSVFDEGFSGELDLNAL